LFQHEHWKELVGSMKRCANWIEIFDRHKLCVRNRGFTDEFCVQGDTFGCTFVGANYGCGCKNKRYK
jgi:hypothetical protein